MFTDPQVLTINSVAKSLPRIKSDGTSSIYQMPDESFKMTISHQISKDRLRSMVRVDQRAVVPDPLTAVNDWETLTHYTITERPIVGFTLSQVQFLVAGHQGWLDATSIGKLFGQES